MHHFPNVSPLFYMSRNYTAPKEVSLRDKKVSPGGLSSSLEGKETVQNYDRTSWKL